MRKIVCLSLLMLVSCSQAEDDLRTKLQESLSGSFDNVEVTAVREAPVEGLVEVELNGSDRVYATRDGRFLFTGDLLEITDQGVENVTERRLGRVRAEAIKALDEQQMITFPAAEEKAEVYAFTDVTCGYCRRLHQDMSRLNELGITVHYLAFPRGGMDSGAANTMEKVWCAEDRHSALTEAKLSGGLSVDPEACENPVAEQYQLGQRFGVRGTPAIYTSEGEQLGGYLPPEKMAAVLGLEQGAKAD